ncbi:amidohydrolase [Candidatus Bathyarchaeota archaeon]|nr:amidohydrolase [Candidatus Bathyarchaeota archaeon]
MTRADLVLINGNIITMDSSRPKASCLAVGCGRIIAVGEKKKVLAESNDATVIDLHGKTVIPGFIDSHVHGVALGSSLSRINLRGVKSIREIQRIVQRRVEVTSNGDWVIGRGWDQDQLSENRYPTRFDLDEVSPHNPVLLYRTCGHVCVVNSRAINAAGLTAHGSTEELQGGWIDLDDDTGEPTGILRENALKLISDVLPKPNSDELTGFCLAACQKMVEEGITTVHWIVSSPGELQILSSLEKRNLVPLRIYIMIPIEYLGHLVSLGISTGFGSDRLRIGCVKVMCDGSLGGRTAALEEPYADSIGSRGALLLSREQLEEYVKKAHLGGLQLAIHAIGDRTIGIVLETLKNVIQSSSELEHRHRIEHASVLNPTLMEKMRSLGVIASIQPHFIASDFWITERLGKTRARWTYPLKSLLEKDIVSVAGSDAPVEPVSPLMGICAAVTANATPSENLTVDQGLRLYTLMGAYASYEENVKGSIEVGKFADFVILSEDPYKIQPEQIKEVKVEKTIVAGEVVHDRKDHRSP